MQSSAGVGTAGASRARSIAGTVYQCPRWSDTGSIRLKGETMATRKDLTRWYRNATHCKVGYCCYQDAGVNRFDLVELGCNAGVYGWNWTAYLDASTDTLYVDCYRNVPSYIAEK